MAPNNTRMLNRLHLLKRFFPFQILHQPLILNPKNNLNTHIFNLSSFSSTKTAAKCNTNSQNSLSFKPLAKDQKQTQAQSFKAEAAETEETADSSLFSPYQSVRIRCNKDVAEALSEALLCFGANSATLDELESYGDLAETWITSIFTDDQDVHACISHAADSIGMNHTPSYEVSTGKPYDWVANIQETFHPTEITDGLWIVPKWRTPLDSRATNIILDPRLAFGTGDHPTTKLCLLMLKHWIKGGEHFFDYGAGSGVLGIAALKMGAAFSLGIDIDPEAVASARQNIALNKIDSNKMAICLVPINNTFEERTSNNLELIAAKQKFDIVIANILLNPLMELAEDVISFGKPGAIIGLTGILSEQVQQIKELYSQYLETISVSEMDGWAFVHGTRKKDLI